MSFIFIRQAFFYPFFISLPPCAIFRNPISKIDFRQFYFLFAMFGGDICVIILMGHAWTTPSALSTAVSMCDAEKCANFQIESECWDIVFLVRCDSSLPMISLSLSVPRSYILAHILFAHRNCWSFEWLLVCSDKKSLELKIEKRGKSCYKVACCRRNISYLWTIYIVFIASNVGNMFREGWKLFFCYCYLRYYLSRTSALRALFLYSPIPSRWKAEECKIVKIKSR